MAKMNRQFDANQVDPSNAFEVFAPGWYAAQIEKSEMKQTKAKDGSYLSLMFKILDGEAKGRTVFTNLNLDNPNPVAVEIAERNFSAICHATGILVVDDTNQLHGKPMQIKVSITPAEGRYEARNEVKGYKPLEDTPAFATGENNNTDATQGDTAAVTEEAHHGETDDDGDVPEWLKD